MVEPTLATVVWDTDVESAGGIDYSTGVEPELTVTDGKVSKHHVVQIEGLKPHSNYSYRLMNAQQPLSPVFAFHTAPELGQPTTFVVLGDTRTDHEAHRSVISRARKVHPDFYIHTGDLVENGSSEEQWNTFFSIEAPLLTGSAIFPVLGNHDLGGTGYVDAFSLPNNERWYSFDFGDVHVAALDSFSPLTHGSPQYTWLQDDLSHAILQWKIVVMHLPLYSSGPHGGDAAMRKNLVPLFEKYGVDMVFSGHDHDYERTTIDGITYIISGGGGAPLSKVGRSLSTQYSESVHHFVKVVADDKQLRLASYRTNGTEFDPFTVTKESEARARQGASTLLAGQGSVAASASLAGSSWQADAFQLGAEAIGVGMTVLAGFSLIGGGIVLVRRRQANHR